MATIQDLNALFKEVYSSKVETLVPEGINLLNDVSFSETDKLGDVYVFPIMTKGETGFTVSDQNDAFDLVNPNPAIYSQAKVSPFSIVLQSAISYEQAARAMNNKQTVERATARTLAEMKKAMMRRIESMCFYGGETPSFVGSHNAQVRDDTDSRIHLGLDNHNTNIDITASSAKITSTQSLLSGRAIASDIVGATVVIRASGPLGRTGVTADDLVVSFVVKSLTDSDTSMEFDPSADTTTTFNDASIDLKRNDYISVEESSPALALVGTDGFDGINKQITQQTGTRFGLDINSVALFKGNQYNVAGKLTVEKILNASELAVNNGLEGRARLYISHRTYVDLSDELDKNYRMSDKFMIPYQAGVLEVVPSIYVRADDGFLLKPSSIKRVGAQDISFEDPVKQQNGPFHKMENNAGLLLRCQTNQAIVVEKPAQCVKLYGITS